MNFLGYLIRNIKEMPILNEIYRYYTEIKISKSHKNKSLNEIFDSIREDNKWGGKESVSGVGSDLNQTKEIIKEIPKLLNSINAKTILDLPCGDHYWMKEVDLGNIKYIGGDIVEYLINSNNELYGNENKKFLILDLTKDNLPKADLILVRDCFVHLSFNNIKKAIENLKHSDIKYLLTTTFPLTRRNYDITDGNWRPLNLNRPPFNFPPPISSILEKCTESYGQYPDKSLYLWRIDEIPFLSYDV